jgi:hypothetical protein
MNKKYPDLNVRYAVGVGDLIASFLHSKILSWLVVLITGKDNICMSCSKRRHALNDIIPIKFWKFWFNNEIEYLENLTNFYKSCGFDAVLDYNNRYVKVYSKDRPTQVETQSSKDANFTEINKEGYFKTNTNEVVLGDYIIKTIYYKRI